MRLVSLGVGKLLGIWKLLQHILKPIKNAFRKHVGGQPLIVSLQESSKSLYMEAHGVNFNSTQLKLRNYKFKNHKSVSFLFRIEQYMASLTIHLFILCFSFFFVYLIISTHTLTYFR